MSALANAGLLEEKLQNRELKTKGSQEAALGALGNSTLLRKGLLHSGLGGFDKLINLSFLLPKRFSHLNPPALKSKCPSLKAGRGRTRASAQHLDTAVFVLRSRGRPCGEVYPSARKVLAMYTDV